MKIRFLGHAAFFITTDRGIRIITDPYRPGCFGGGIKYGQITEEADIVTISHEHDDHNDTNIAGKPSFVKGAGKKNVKGVTITGVDTYHDETSGKERGSNTIFSMAIDDMNVVHLGDLGHSLTPAEADKIGKVDVLLVPVGGHFTIDAQTAENVINTLKPKVVIPMHYKTEKCGFPIAAVEDFIRNKEVKKVDGEVEIKKDTLPSTTAIYVLTHTK